MVKGLDLFKEHFKEYTDQYILIGGAACDIHLEHKGIAFRSTFDLDIILVVEALDKTFVSHFYEFIKAGEYSLAEVNARKCFYRFHQPKAKGYPLMLELFAREPDVLDGDHQYHVIDIRPDDEASSLSAILLEKEYYDFLIAQNTIQDEVHVANELALICLKAKAYLNNRALKDMGVDIQSDKVLKHRRDVLRLIITLNPDQTASVPLTIQTDLKRFSQVLQKEVREVEGIIKQLGFGRVKGSDVITRLEQTFGLANA